MKYIRTGMVGLVATLLLASSALALTGTEVLQKAQDAMRPGEDMTATERMTITTPDGNEEVMELILYRKGDKVLMRITAPEEFAGIAVLILPQEEGNGEDTWLYLPAFRNVKQIVTEGMSEGFVGSDFAYEDLTVRYTTKWNVLEMAEEASQYILDLEPKADAGLSYNRARFLAAQGTFLPQAVEFDKAGELFKVMTLSEVTEINGYPTPQRIEMANVKAGSKTVIELLDVQYDTSLEDELFTVRSLKRG